MCTFLYIDIQNLFPLIAFIINQEENKPVPTNKFLRFKLIFKEIIYNRVKIENKNYSYFKDFCVHLI